MVRCTRKQKGEASRYEISVYPAIRLNCSAHTSYIFLYMLNVECSRKAICKQRLLALLYFFRPLVCVRTEQHDPQSMDLLILNIWYTY